MSRLSLSFTERRRARLSLKFDRLDRLESRNTMTEPISVTALSLSAFRSLPLLGIVQADGGKSASLEFAQMVQQARQGQNSAHQARPAVDNFPSVTIGPAISYQAPRAAGGGGPAQELAIQASATIKPISIDSLALTLLTDTDEAQPVGISIPWHPASRAGGGAALAPRGGAGNGAQAATIALVSGRGGGAAQPQSSLPASIPGYRASNPPQTASDVGSRTQVVSRNGAAASQWFGNSSPSLPGITKSASGFSSGPGPVTIVENPSSLPYRTTGNSSGAAMFSFAYFPLYTLDYNQGTVLFPGGYQLATLDGSMDLRAQTSGASGVTYSWNTSNLNGATSISGSSTYDLTFTWPMTNLFSSYTDSVTLTATNASSQQESQTYYFVIPSGSAGSGGSTTWPTTLSPDTVSPMAPSWSGDGVSVNADSGALDTTLPLPSYNPNVPALALTYDSLTANPMPIIVVPHSLDPTQAVPSVVTAQLTFNGTALTTWYYDTSSFTPGDVEQIALQATNATSLATGRYGYSVQIIDYRSGTPTTFTYSGTATVLNQSSSGFGDGWTLYGLEQITTASGGVILNTGSAGTSLWFSGSPGSGGGTYTSPAGEFSTLVLNSNGTYTRTLTDGTQINFNSSGYETSTVDLNGLTTTYAYNGSNQLTSIEDPYGGYTTFTYSSGKLSTIQDPAGRLATMTFSGSNLAAVQQADGTHVSYMYDGSGRMTQLSDPMANLVTISYDSAERVGTITQPDLTTEEFSADQEQGWTNSGTSGSPTTATLLGASGATFTDPNGNMTTVRPDWWGLGTAGQVTDALGNTATFDYNANGLPTIVIDRLNRISQYTYNSQGNVTEEIYPDGTNAQYTYNSDSEPLTFTNQDGNTTSYTYDSHGNLTVVQDPLHNRTTMTYTSNGQVQTETDANNHTTSYQFDSQDRLTTVTNPDSTTMLYGYNNQGNVIKVTDERNDSTTYSFDALNRETGTTDAVGDATTYVYNADGDLTQNQQPTPAGQTARTTVYTFSSMNRVTVVTDPLGLTTSIGYDANGNQVWVKDPLGRITSTIYDALNRPTVVVDPMGNRVTTTYDAEGEKLTVTDALGRTTTNTYSVRGWLATTTDPMGFIATYTYTPTGKNSATYQTTQFPLEESFLAYDADDRLIGQENGLSETTSYAYDAVGNVIAVTDPNTNTTSYSYDSRNRVTTVTDALGHNTVIGYDANGNKETVTDALGHTTTTLYDAMNRATTIISAISGTTTITYDSAGREISLTDPVGNETQWAYDSDDRLTTLTEPNGHTVTYVYDNDGELTDTTDEDGRRTTYSYNADGDQTGETWVGASPSEKITYTYDADNEMTGAADSFATLTFTYNNDGWLLTDATSGPGSGQPTVTLTYSYDQLGEETSVTDSLSSQGITTYTYSAAQQLTNISTSYGGTSGPLVTFTYDNASRLTNISRSVSGVEADINTTISYDNANRVVTMTDGAYVFDPYDFGYVNTPLATYAYGYDNANRETSEHDAEGTYTYAYDSANELTSAFKSGTQVESYSYDLSGNRNSTGYTTGTENETTASPGVTYSYDNAGNMISSTNTSTHVTTTFTYDYRDRLTEVTSGGTVVATYTYNALDQRIGVKESGTQTWTAYDGMSADANPYADFNGSGSLTERYLFGPGVVNGAVTTVILARISSGGTTAWYLTDKLGSVRDIVDTSGNELDHIVYDSFGNVVTETHATNGDGFKFAGMQYDATVGQYFDHARWYLSLIGTYQIQDPKGFAGGDINLFRYVGNSATQATDPSGLAEVNTPSPGDINLWQYYITNPSQMDTDLRLAFYGSLTIASIAAAWAAALAVSTLLAPAAAEVMAEASMGPAIEAAELSASAVETELQACVQQALGKFAIQEYTTAQRLRISLNPKMAQVFKGERVDTFFKEFVINNPKLTFLKITPRFKFGPDVFNPSAKIWYDLTTSGQWAAHVTKYTARFGVGIPLFWE